ncbi:2-hydroxymuconate tautomerase [Pseudomonas sp. NPDC008258]|uniref:2-hydroxymuconate tautomerase n=1 Tax=Pseudomonas sp. NPDC008258 TaxID=3364418 RepID=UPI0036E9F384
MVDQNNDHHVPNKDHDEGFQMPIVRVELLTGRSQEQKNELAAVLTRETARIARCPEEHIQVIISDYQRSDWAVGGVMNSVPKETAQP